MKAVFIGAGNLAAHLSVALQDAGTNTVQVYSRTEAPARELAAKLGASYTTDMDDITDDASLYIIAAGDDAIAPLSRKLPATPKLVVHTSGSVGVDVLAERFDNCGVLYPLQTFSRQRPVNLADVPLFIEATNRNSLLFLRRIAETVSRRVYTATSAERMQLHLAAVLGSNFVNHLYHLSAQVAHRAGFDFSLLSPLILETARKALAAGDPADVQTGPAVRGDDSVMRRHLDMLAAHPEWKDLYAMMSAGIQSAHGRSCRAGD